MARRYVSSGSRFEKLAGYSRAVVDGDWIFVAGTTGFNYEADTIAEDAGEQTEQCFRNIAAALGEAGATLDDVVRVRYYLSPDVAFEHVAPIWGRHFAGARPAATAVTTGFIDDRIKIEIEVTAKRRG